MQGNITNTNRNNNSNNNMGDLKTTILGDLATLVEENEEKLQEHFMKNDGMMFLDDDLPDAFDAWATNLTIEEFNKIV